MKFSQRLNRIRSALATNLSLPRSQRSVAPLTLPKTWAPAGYVLGSTDWVLVEGDTKPQLVGKFQGLSNHDVVRIVSGMTYNLGKLGILYEMTYPGEGKVVLRILSPEKLFKLMLSSVDIRVGELNE